MKEKQKKNNLAEEILKPLDETIQDNFPSEQKSKDHLNLVVEKIGEYDDLDNKEIKQNVCMFVSFDIVNSSIYKSNNYDWFKVIYSLLTMVNNEVNKNIKNIELWRSIGDELVFVSHITTKEQLKENIKKVYKILIDINKSIKEGKIFNDISESDDERAFLVENNLLELKSTAWIAKVSEIEKKSDLSKNITGNIMYSYDKSDGAMYFEEILLGNISNKKTNRPTIEFQGKDIDLGFRIAKYNTKARKLTLSVELAYILSNDSSMNPRLHIIGYNKLKGIWNQRPYPIIWYHDEYEAGCKINESFSYDEDDSKDREFNIVANYLNKDDRNQIRDKMSKNVNEHLKKLVFDMNISMKIKSIMDILDKDSSCKKLFKSEENTHIFYLEVHCVAVCVNKNKVLMFKRSSSTSKFPDKWDFGCAKMVKQLTFEDVLKREYKDFAGIDIKIKRPFRHYHFKSEVKDDLICGIRFKAELDDNQKINLAEGKKYIKYKYFDLDEFDKFNEENSVDGDSPFIDYKDFRGIIEEVLS